MLITVNRLGQPQFFFPINQWTSCQNQIPAVDNLLLSLLVDSAALAFDFSMYARRWIELMEQQTDRFPVDKILSIILLATFCCYSLITSDLFRVVVVR